MIALFCCAQQTIALPLTPFRYEAQAQRHCPGDTVVWLDPPRYQVMRRVIWRTLRRVISRAELWNGNREPWSNVWSVDPKRSIIAWAWTQHAAYRKRYGAALTDPTWSHVTFVVLRSRSEIENFVVSLGQSTTA